MHPNSRRFLRPRSVDPADFARALGSCPVALWSAAAALPGGGRPVRIPVAVSVMGDGSGVSFLAPGGERSLAAVAQGFGTLMFSRRVPALAASVDIRVVQASLCTPGPGHRSEACYLIVAKIERISMQAGGAAAANTG